MEEVLLGLGKLALGIVIVVPLVMYFAQDALIFQPHPITEPQRVAIEQRAAPAQSVFIEGADGTRLHAWHLKGPPGAPLVMYFGGNAEEVSWMLGEAKARAPQAGWLLVDYRGYGASGGSPSEKALTEDALRWYDKYAAGERTFVLGRSLGSGVAVQLAAARPLAGVILIAPYDSLVNVAGHYYPYLPVSWLLKHRFESAAAAPKMAVPLLCIVATRDEVIPTVNSQRLYEAWAGPKRWVALDGATHNTTDDHPAFWPSINAFIQ